jgi:glycerophosphoryl diester phosphodiesterase
LTVIMRNAWVALATAIFTVVSVDTGCRVILAAQEAPLVCPTVVSHRSAMLDAPENTVAGIKAVTGQGVTSVEIDVQWSASSFPVLMHDSTVDRTTNGAGAAATLGLGTLTGLLANDFAPWKTDPAYAGDKAPHVPYGWEFMDAVSRYNLDVILDIHATPTELGTEKLAHYVNLFEWGPRTLVMGSESQVTAMRAWEPGLRYALIEYNPPTTIRRGESLTALGVEAYAVPARDISPAAVDYWHSYGVQVLTWTSDSAAIDVPATWARVTDAGVDTIITNEPSDVVASCGNGARR